MIKKTASVFKALSDRSRAGIFEVLLEGEKNVTEIIRATGLSQPRVSRHLRILKEGGLVQAKRNGKWVSYRAGGGGIQLLLGALEGLREIETGSLDLTHDKKRGAPEKTGGKSAGRGTRRGAREEERPSSRRPDEERGRKQETAKKEIEDFLL
jgi:DNA-binding transcriptional ArsR family regulator